MAPSRQSQQDYFRTLLRTVVGQALDAAGYRFQTTPLQCRAENIALPRHSMTVCLA